MHLFDIREPFIQFKINEKIHKYERKCETFYCLSENLGDYSVGTRERATLQSVSELTMFVSIRQKERWASD